MTNYTRNRAAARKPRDAAAVLFGLKFTNDDVHYKYKSSRASKAITPPLQARNFSEYPHKPYIIRN